MPELRDVKPPKAVSRPVSTPVAEKLIWSQELRSILLPQNKWHYLFHLVVILVALAYWVVSCWKLPDASWREIVMYRPNGDSQVYPVITALSHLNFGDPTDAFHYGKGVAGFHAVILFPYALAVAILGWPGYMVTDALLSWVYFIAIVLLLRRCNFGILSSLALGSALATGSLQDAVVQFNIGLAKVITILGLEASEWAFPNLLNLHIFSKRIPRPMITEIFVVLSLYELFPFWSRSRTPTFKAGLALGAFMALVMQGDPYSFAALGLVCIGTLLYFMANHQWRVPWRFVGGASVAGLLVASYFFVQIFYQEPDSAVRFGLFSFPRSRLMFLVGYGPLLRLGVVVGLAGLVLWIARKSSSHAPASTSAASLGKPVACFCILVVAAAWLAQPVQIFLLGKGSEIYHYLIATLPAFYSYALILLLGQLVRIGFPQPASASGDNPLRASLPARAFLLTCLFLSECLLGLSSPLDAAHSLRTARDESGPWAQVGDNYRPAFRALDKAFQEDPTLKNSRTFATFNHEINFLLAGFHDKRAYLPDNGFTTLRDSELENRLFEVCKICKLSPAQYGNLVQNVQIMNYWLGCAKYWFALGQTYAPLSEYPEQEVARLKDLGREPVFNLVMPKNELERLRTNYSDCIGRNSDVSKYPDVLVMTSILTQQGVVPNSYLYREIYTNEVFLVYSKTLTNGNYAAAPTPSK